LDRPSATSPEFRAYLLEIVMTSRGLREAANRMGYRDPKTVHYHMKKFGIKSPPEWARRPHLGLVAQEDIPEIIIPTSEGRCWVGALLQGEGCIQSVYRKISDSTYLEADVAMVDPAAIFKLSEYFGLSRPSKSIKNHQWKQLWRKCISGLRALRVLQETIPFLVGQKLKEAEKAVAFFTPRGHHRGCFRNADIWPQNEFPLRTKLRGSNQLSSNSPDEGRTNKRLWSRSGWIPLSNQPEKWQIISTQEDRCWVAALIQGEGSIGSYYVKSTDSTTIALTVGMTDPAPIFKFSDHIGLSRPTRPKPSRSGKPVWRKIVYSRRAFRILQEVRPFLVGEKLREAERALEFFSQGGLRRGCIRPITIWPPDEFPLRRRRHFAPKSI
jgi:hypothetical protein